VSASRFPGTDRGWAQRPGPLRQQAA